MIILDDMGHLYSDESLHELYDFAVIKMGLKEEWNHYSTLFPHFDVFSSMKSKAISLGAVRVDARTDMSVHVNDGVSHYDKCKSWCRVLAGKCKDKQLDNILYEDVGLVGQKIKRLRITKILKKMNK